MLEKRAFKKSRIQAKLKQIQMYIHNLGQWIYPQSTTPDSPPTPQQRFTARSLEPNLSWQQPLDSFHGSSKVNDHSDLEAFAWAPQYKNGNARKKPVFAIQLTSVCCWHYKISDDRRPKHIPLSIFMATTVLRSLSICICWIAGAFVAYLKATLYWQPLSGQTVKENIRIIRFWSMHSSLADNAQIV